MFINYISNIYIAFSNTSGWSFIVINNHQRSHSSYMQSKLKLLILASQSSYNTIIVPTQNTRAKFTVSLGTPQMTNTSSCSRKFLCQISPRTSRNSGNQGDYHHQNLSSTNDQNSSNNVMSMQIPDLEIQAKRLQPEISTHLSTQWKRKQ